MLLILLYHLVFQIQNNFSVRQTKLSKKTAIEELSRNTFYEARYFYSQIQVIQVNRLSDQVR